MTSTNLTKRLGARAGILATGVALSAILAGSAMADPAVIYDLGGKFAKSFDDEGARNGWCLFELGCKGPTTYNACATIKWNGGTSFPIESGHNCLGCSEPGFWDKGSFYSALSAPAWGKSGETSPFQVLELGGGAAAAGAVLGAASAGVSRLRQHGSEHAADNEPKGV